MCKSVCGYGEDGKTCQGCGRTADEITEWFTATNDRKKEIVKSVRLRKKKLDIPS